ncbi:MAG: amidohydrolase family protein [Hyphomicrobiales bacterium]|nr:amidohydrolase family protein [Hyphomicrobiales bacterium]
MTYDIIVRGGTVVDGTRLPRYRADVAIKNGRVARIGRLDKAVAKRVLDATGCIVAPGFVDLHTHYDAQIHWDPYCTISGWHGVTSLVLGNCGFGFAPVKPAERERAMLMMTRTEQIPYASMQVGMPWKWETFPEWLDNLERLPKGVNIVSYVPVSPLMVYVMGLEAAKSRPATPAEQAEMKRLLNEAMDAGACGFSIQRLGEHSLQADVDGTPMPTDCMADEDVFALAEVLRDRDEGFIQITQAQGGDPVHAEGGSKSRDRAFLEKLAEVAQRPILHNAVAALDDTPDFHVNELAWVHDCNARGLRIYAQGANVRTWFNFSLEFWNLYDASPAWNAATQGTIEEKMKKLSDPFVRAQMIAEHAMLKSIGDGSVPENLTIVATPGAPELERYVGRKVGDIARSENKHPTDAMLDIAVAGKLRVEFRTGLATSGNPDLVGPLMNDPYVMAGVSDGGAHTKFFTGGSYTTDFLTWLVRDTKKVSLEEAHYHLSYLPAQAAGFLDRGFLREGAPADIVVYDLANLKRTPEWEFEIVHDFPADEWRRVQRSEGYRWTLVNGEVTFEDGTCTGATPGKLLRNRNIGAQAFADAAE